MFPSQRRNNEHSLLLGQLSIFSDFQGEIDQLSGDERAEFDVFSMLGFGLVRLNNVM